MTLSEWLARQEAKRYVFAEAVGCSPARISQICGGQTPGLKLAVRIVEETGGAVTLEELTGATCRESAA